MASYRTTPSNTIALDDLPAPRCAEAMALLALLRRRPLRWFVAGSYSAGVAMDLERCGYLRLTRDDTDIVTLLRAEVLR